MNSFVKIRFVLLFYVLLVILLSLTPNGGVSVGNSDKVGHFFAYAGMAILALLSFDGKSARLAALLGAVGLGALLEWGQSFVPGREMSLADGIANTLGVLVGALFFRFFSNIWLNWIRSHRSGREP